MNDISTTPGEGAATHSANIEHLCHTDIKGATRAEKLLAKVPKAAAE